MPDPLRVRAVCGYPGRSEAWEGRWDPPHYRARNLVKGVKGEHFNGYSEWTAQPSGRVYRQVATDAGRRVAIKVAASKLTALLDKAGIKNARIVPVPSSQTVAPGSSYTGAMLARAIEERRPGLLATPALFFDSPRPKAHDGSGERRCEMILPHLRGSIDADGPPVVLLDDVLTGGGHLRACRLYLRRHGVECTDAVVIGRTVRVRPHDMFQIGDELLPL